MLGRGALAPTGPPLASPIRRTIFMTVLGACHGLLCLYAELYLLRCLKCVMASTSLRRTWRVMACVLGAVPCYDGMRHAVTRVMLLLILTFTTSWYVPART